MMIMSVRMFLRLVDLFSNWDTCEWNYRAREKNDAGQSWSLKCLNLGGKSRDLKYWEGIEG